MNNNTTYQPLGKYIRQVDVRNRDLAVTQLMGINIDKFFMPSVANVIGTDLSAYKIVQYNQFACNLMHVGRDERLPISLLKTDDSIIVSPAYYVFEVLENSGLLPDYLMLWFRRAEFDRNAWFYTDSDVRGGMSKEALLDMRLPVPSIAEQQAIVDEYETIARRIRTNEQLIAKLEETAQTFYRQMFVDNIDKENLPEGWRMGTLGEVCSKLGSGATPKGGKDSYCTDGISLIRSTNVFDYRFVYEDLAKINEDQAKALNNVTVKLKDILFNITGVSVTRCCIVPDDVLPARVNQHVMIIRPKVPNMTYYLLCMLCYAETKNSLLGISQAGSTREAITKDEMEHFRIIIPTDSILQKFEANNSILFNRKELLEKENQILTKLQSLLLAKMGNKKI